MSNKLKTLIRYILFAVVICFGMTTIIASGGDGNDSGNTNGSSSEKTYYKDTDGDGYSDGTNQTAIIRPSSYFLEAELTATSGDCDDSDPDIHPGAEEIPNDGINQDCSGTEGEWTWVSGDDTVDQFGIYGTKGTGSIDNKPGARRGSVSWIDSSDNLWLFGGETLDFGSNGFFNDLWKFNPSTGEWTWISGDDTVDQLGIYGTKGTGSIDNKPGSRYGGVSWIDSSGDLWLFGGNGYSASDKRYLNDLWKFDPSTGEWTWVSGDDTADQFGIYGTKGTGSIDNKPGARWDSVSWVDISDNLWLFGGLGRSASDLGVLNDLWKFDSSTGEWTWVSGDVTVNQLGIYGTKGTGSIDNKPGARWKSVTWVDSLGDLWLFGGSGSVGIFNDLWKFDLSTGEWTWISGDDTVNQFGIYGIKGTGSIDNKPGSREDSVSWIDSSGNLWLFEGVGNDSFNRGCLNDLWKYEP